MKTNRATQETGFFPIIYHNLKVYMSGIVYNLEQNFTSGLGLDSMTIWYFDHGRRISRLKVNSLFI